jgi:hypothetical protein
MRKPPPPCNLAQPLRLYSVIGSTASNRQVRGLPKVDGRTRAGRIAKAFREDLINYLGGEPNVNIVQREIVERCVFLQLKISLMDQKICAGKDTEYDSKVYLAWSNSLQRSLIRLGYRESVEIMRKRAENQLLKAYRN